MSVSKKPKLDVDLSMDTSESDATSVVAPKGLPQGEQQRCVGIFTSGGDAQGMNAAVRASVRMAMLNGLKVYGIYEGYQGLVEGGDLIKELKWMDVSGILHSGGTILGTARCKAFRERDGRLTAAENMIKAGINNLIVIGGDGSLTGASIFKDEWSGLVKELISKERVPKDALEKYSYLNIVGMVGSIDNDMHGTDMTIGADSALYRIIDAVDCIMNTADSHQRSFVIEVMGRHCGYLALMAGIAGAADWVLIPEKPPKKGWEEKMCNELKEGRNKGRRMGLVMVAEGAIDDEGKAITAQMVKDILHKDGHDVRITVLGHVQRGGNPSAFDRILGSRMGAEAAIVIAKAKGSIEPVLIALESNKMTRAPLMDMVTKTRDINTAMTEKNFDKALELRGRSFQSNLSILKKLNRVSVPPKPAGVKFRFGVINVGAPACGMNSAVCTFVRLLLYEGHTVFCIHNGFEGLEKGGNDIREVKWIDVNGWGSMGGCKLCTNRTLPNKDTLPKIAENLQKNEINGLYLIGGFEGYEALTILEEARKDYPQLRIPLLGTPATVSNNVPGSDYSLGSDTALNAIVSACDTIKQSAASNRKRVFVVETQGGYCGYLATMGGLAAGADTAYIFEEPFTVADLQKDVSHLVKKFEHGIERGLLLRNEKCSEYFSTDFMVNLLQAEGEGLLIARSCILGHLQQGGNPSPYDRIYGAKISSKAAEKIVELANKYCKDGKVDTGVNSAESACMVGVSGNGYCFTPLQNLKTTTKLKQRLPGSQWWINLRVLLRNLAHHTDMIFEGDCHSSFLCDDPSKASSS